MFCRLASTTIALWLAVSAAPARAASPSGSVQVEPENVSVGVFYSGQEIRVTASAPTSDAVVMRITGPDEPLALKKKGKKFGVLWMNVGEVHYEAVPTLYILRCSSKLEEMATSRTRDRLNLGVDALKNRVTAGSEDNARELFGELVKLKQRDRLFSFEEGDIELTSTGTGQQATGEFRFPAKAPVGDYTVDVFSLQDGEGELIGTATIHLERSSVVSFITSLAANHGLLYGCLAVGVAVLAGLLTGFVFGKLR